MFQFSERLDNLLESLCTEMDVEDVAAAEKSIQELTSRLDNIGMWSLMWISLLRVWEAESSQRFQIGS